MPAARRAAADAGIDPAAVTPSGPGGRVLKEDVQRQVALKAPKAAAAPAAAGPATPRTPDERGEEIVNMTPMRRKIKN